MDDIAEEHFSIATIYLNINIPLFSPIVLNQTENKNIIYKKYKIKLINK